MRAIFRAFILFSLFTRNLNRSIFSLLPHFPTPFHSAKNVSHYPLVCGSPFPLKTSLSLSDRPFFTLLHTQPPCSPATLPLFSPSRLFRVASPISSSTTFTHSCSRPHSHVHPPIRPASPAATLPDHKILRVCFVSTSANGLVSEVDLLTVISSLFVPPQLQHRINSHVASALQQEKDAL